MICNSFLELWRLGTYFIWGRDAVMECLCKMWSVQEFELKWDWTTGYKYHYYK